MSVRREKRRTPKGTEKWYWIVDFVFRHPDMRHERIRKYSPVNSKRGAEAYEREIRERMLGLDPLPATKECMSFNSFNSFKGIFMDTYALGNNKHSEIESKKSILKYHLCPAFGTRRLDRIGHDEIARYKAEKLQANLAPKTVNNQLSVLYCMLNEAYNRRLVTSVPQRQWVKAAKPSFRYLGFDEAGALLAVSTGLWRVMVLVALKSGLRIGELLALRWCDVDFAQRQITVRQAYSFNKLGTPKSDKPRSIPMGDELWAELKKWRHLRGPLVFCHSDGSPIAKGQCKWPLWKASVGAGLGRIGWHVLRHTFASHLTILGAPIRTVQELLGHSDIRITMRYAHLSPEARRGAALLLDGTLAAGHGTLMAHETSEAKKANNIK